MVNKDPPVPLEPKHRHSTFCDLVAKGGVTSGVVYPAAIAKLSEQFSFRNLGGTSVGAIAAAAAAAAEYGRRNGGPNNFPRLEGLGDELGSTAIHDKTKLFSLFQPSSHTKKLFAVFTAGLGRKLPLLHYIAAILRQFWLAATTALILCAILAWPALTYPSMTLKLLGIIIVIPVTGITIMVFAAGSLAIHAIRVLPNNYYGLCTGTSSQNSNRDQSWSNDKANAGPALSEWLATFLNELANLPTESSPLTFGNLWWPDVESGEKKRGYDPTKHTILQETDAQFIHLEMITTSVSEGRPYRLPFRQDFDVKENKSFWFKPDELQRFVPKSVVTWMENHPRHSNRLKNMKEKGFSPLPDPWNLPVVAAVRLSLSFPLLLAAVPLYVVKEDDENEPQICWFSDGGICSNFPIHLFDDPIPSWPTFAINLTDDTESKVVRIADTTGTSLRRSNFDFAYGQGNLQETQPTDRTRGTFGQIVAFAKAILFTMQNWNDNTQTVLPGNRDRIVLVPLADQEGGLNLNMPQDVIESLSEKGTLAAGILIQRYGNASAVGLEDHRWVRLRTMLCTMEEYLSKLSMACARIPGLMSLVRNGTGRQYVWRKNQAQIAAQVLTDFEKVGSQLGPDRPLSEKAPRPRPELRSRPRL